MGPRVETAFPLLSLQRGRQSEPEIIPNELGDIVYMRVIHTPGGSKDEV